MSLNLSKIEARFRDEKIAITPFSFIRKNGVYHAIPETIHPHHDNEDNLFLCGVVSYNGFYLIRSSAINTDAKGEQLKALLHFLSDDASNKLCSLQFCSPEQEWTSIASQNQILESLDWEVAHLSLPLSSLFISKQHPPPPISTKKIIERLSVYQNASAWITYGDWLEEEINKTREHIQLKDLSLYALQSKMDDFRHEAKSSLLKDVTEKIDAIRDKITELDHKNKLDEIEAFKLLEFEKELLSERFECVKIVRRESHVLEQLITEVRKVEKEHPFLTPLRQQATILHALMHSQTADDEQWEPLKGQQILLLQLLNCCMGVRTSTCCDTGVERTSFAFSLQIAMIVMFQRHSIDVLTHLLIHWEDEKDSDIAKELKFYVWEAFYQFSMPFLKISNHPDLFTLKDEYIVSKEWMAFFPEAIQQKHIIEHLDSIRSSHG